MISNKKVLGIIGPSGCGKSTIVEMLFEKDKIIVNPTFTDRPRRIGEKNLEHEFITRRKFDDLENQEKFIEVVQPFGLKYRYGTPRLNNKTNKISVLMLRAPFVPQLLYHYPKSIIYQIEASYEFARSAINKRGVRINVGNRLTLFDSEINLGRKYADRIFVNGGHIDELLEEILDKMMKDFII